MSRGEIIALGCIAIGIGISGAHVTPPIADWLTTGLILSGAFIIGYATGRRQWPSSKP